MITIQIISRSGVDAYKMLRDKVTHEAQTWSWKNKEKTRLVHTRGPGYIQVTGSGSLVTAQIHPKDDNAFFLVEKLIGRLVAWFPHDLFAINMQFIPDESKAKKRR